MNGGVVVDTRVETTVVVVIGGRTDVVSGAVVLVVVLVEVVGVVLVEVVVVVSVMVAVDGPVVSPLMVRHRKPNSNSRPSTAVTAVVPAI